MTDPRILHAAARGARLQEFCHNWNTHKPEWRDAGTPFRADRVHPDDAHLLYGPISSALREFAETGKEPYTLSGLLAMEAFRYECPYPFVLKSEWPHAQMFALMLAEELSYGGM